MRHYCTRVEPGFFKGLHLDKQRVLVGLSCRPPRRVLLNVSQTGLQWGDLGRSWTSPPSAKPLFWSCHIRCALIKLPNTNYFEIKMKHNFFCLS